jgi:hypothetical protein
VHAYLFQTPERPVLIAWKSPDADPIPLRWRGEAFQVWDIEGNRVAGGRGYLTDTPLYFIANRNRNPEELRDGFAKMLP